ncbi:MAG: PIN domain-containing protein [Pseudomonadales bacterium]|nr:PIN domain-containing protein [Pseudomonadales bacterium]
MYSVFFDTNTFLRYYLRDNEQQYTECQTLFTLSEQKYIIPHTSSAVCLEVYYVLTKTYRLKKDRALLFLENIFNLQHLTLIEKTNITDAIKLHKKTKIKLADCIIALQVPKNCLLCTYGKDFQKIDTVTAHTPKELLALLS